MDLETKRGLKILAVLVCVVLATACLSGCASVPQAAKEAEKAGTEYARGFCVSRHTNAVTAAAACAELCVSKSNYCARKKCASQLGILAAWDEVADFCAKYTPPIYYERPEWPPKWLTPMPEEDT